MTDRATMMEGAATSSASPQIEAVLFDYGQVLSQGPNAAAWERMRATTGGSAEIFHQAYWTPRHDYDRGTLSGTEYWTVVGRKAGRSSLSAAEMEDLYAADLDLWTDLNLPMVAWARSLQERGIKTGILSNIGDRMESGIRERFDWIAAFDHCTWSHSLKLAKPEVAIYRRAAEGLATEPEQVLFIDDRPENIEGARAAGMVGVLYTEHAAFVEQMGGLGLEALL